MNHSPYSHYSHSPPHAPLGHRQHPRNSDARELLTATILGLGLMATMTTWWWYAMR
jgi:hypothetical protein